MFTESELKSIEEYAAALLPLEAIAALANINEDELRTHINVRTSEASKAYLRGKYSTILAIQQQEITLAKLASPAAVEHASQYLIDMETSEL